MFRFKASKVWKTIKLRVASRKEGLRERWPREGVGNSTVAGIPTISRRTSSTLSRSLSSPYFVTVFRISTVSRALSRFSFVRMLTTSESIARAATAGATAHWSRASFRNVSIDTGHPNNVGRRWKRSVSPRPYRIIPGTMSWLPFNRVTHFPSSKRDEEDEEEKKKKKDPRNRWISRISNPLPFNFPPRVFSSISTRLSDRHLNRNRSVKRWYACNASRVLPSTSRLRNDYSSKSSFQSDSATPNTIRLVLDTFYHFTDNIYICVLEQKRKRRRRRKKVDEKHRDKRKIEEDVTRRLWCSLESTYNVGRWPAFFLYIYI